MSLDELGIQLFALERFEEAMAVFNEVRRIRTSAFGTASPKLAMVLNNIACCNFQMGNHTAAILNLQEARQIQQKVMGSTAKADLDLLHVAVTLCNYGYLQLRLKNYDEARSVFEEALLVRYFDARQRYNRVCGFGLPTAFYFTDSTVSTWRRIQSSGHSRYSQ